MLLIIAILFMAVDDDKPGDIESKAEYLIVLDWDDLSNTDFDLWVDGPGDILVGYKNREGGLLHLERDDLGKLNDTFINSQGQLQVNHINRETVAIRGHQDGRYTANVHVYRYGDLAPSTVTLELVRINPYEVLYVSKVVLSETGQEHTFATFDLTEYGGYKYIGNDKVRIINQSDTMNSIMK